MPNFLLPENQICSLAQEIAKQYNKLIVQTVKIPTHLWIRPEINFSGQNRSLIDIISYQIGWTSLLVNWYEAGVKKQIIQMPGFGFSTWDYTGLANLFYQEFFDQDLFVQITKLKKLVQKIIQFVELENEKHQLDKLGVWSWCTLASGKMWPLSKWVQVNTVAPFRRACAFIRGFEKRQGLS